MGGRTKIVKVTEPPAGFLYVQQFLSESDQHSVLEKVKSLDFHNYVYQGFTAKRMVKYFGYSYEFYTAAVRTSEPFPQWLAELRDKAASTMHLEPTSFEQALVAYYPHGAAIGWHRDAPAFGPSVLGISLGSAETMRFRRETEAGFEIFKQPLSRGSLYAIQGVARSVWQHSLPPVKQERFSITFRTVRPRYLPDGLPSATETSIVNTMS